MQPPREIELTRTCHRMRGDRESCAEGTRVPHEERAFPSAVKSRSEASYADLLAGRGTEGKM